MSNSVFPALPGLSWSVNKTPKFSTRIQRAVSGREFRSPYYSYPLWSYNLSYEVLRADSINLELQTLMGFFMQRQGAYDSFLYSDPSDNAVTTQQIGTGNGSNKVFQLTRTLGGFTEPIANPDLSNVAIYRNNNDWQGNTLMYSTPRTNSLSQSKNLANAAWLTSTNLGSFFTVAASTDIPAPDGNSANVTKFTASAGTRSELFARQLATFAAGQKVVSYYVYVPAGQSGITSWTAYCDWQDTETGTGNTSSLFGQWVRISSTATLAGSRAWLDLNLKPNNAIPPAGFIFYAAFVQEEPGAIATPFITTTTAAVTVTDYSLSPNTDTNTGGLITFANAPANGALVTWTGKFYQRVRFADDSSDFENFMYNLWQAKKVNLVTAR